MLLTQIVLPFIKFIQAVFPCPPTINLSESVIKIDITLPQTPVKSLVCGIADSERPFVNHLVTCVQYKPKYRTYCGDGLKLKAEADSNSV